MNAEYFLENVEKLKDLNKDAPIIVEGKRDYFALKKMGIEGEIIIFNFGYSIPLFSEIIAKKYRKVILLFDWDERGNILTKEIFKNLSALGVQCILDSRESFQRFLKSASSVEDLFPIYEDILEEVLSGKDPGKIRKFPSLKKSKVKNKSRNKF